MVETIKYEVHYRNVTVKTSDGSMVTGKINIAAFPRLSDMLKHATDKFVTVFSEEGEGGPRRVTIINKEYIVWAETED
jgi:hypothetical protein